MLAVHAAGLAVLPFAPLAPWLQLLVTFVVVLSLYRNWLRHVTRRCSALQALIWLHDRECRIITRHGEPLDGVLLPQVFVMPWLVILHYRSDGRRHSLFILPDMLPAVTFRRLRVRLLIQPVQAQARHVHGR